MEHLTKWTGLFVIASVAFAAMPVNAQGFNASYGVLSLTFASCPADQVVALGVNDGVTWDWVVLDTNTDPGCASVDAAVYSGPDPIAGGCSSAGVPGGGLCLNGAVVTGNTVHYSSVKMCFQDPIFSFCIIGTGDLTFA